VLKAKPLPMDEQKNSVIWHDWERGAAMRPYSYGPKDGFHKQA